MKEITEQITILILQDRINHHMTIKQLMKKYSLNQKNVSKILKDNNINAKLLRHKNHKHYNNTNRDFFKHWSSEMAWLLGFIHADGCITNNNTRLYFCCARKDRNILNKIRQMLCPSKPIKKRNTFLKKTNKSYEQCVLWINSVDIIKDLLTIGIEPRKTRKRKNIKYTRTSILRLSQRIF